jgi:transcriptional regulator with XRE-family HTH domain
MDYKNESGERIRRARLEKGWTQEELSRRTDDVISLKRISHYEKGRRMAGPEEAVILAKALGKRTAYLMAVDDVQLPISVQEEALIKNWRTLNERDRMDLFRKVEALAMANRDPVPNQRVEETFGPTERARSGAPRAARPRK